MNDRQLGQQLADAIGPASQAAPGQVVAVLHDLLGSDLSLLAPLKDLVSRPGFQALTGQRTAKGSTQAQREALLHAMGETYQPQVVSRLNAFLEGYLGSQPAEPARATGAAWAEPAPPPPASAVPETEVIDDNDDSPSTAAAGPGPTAGAAPAAMAARTSRRIPLLAAGGAVVLAVGGAVVLAAGAALRGNLLCAPLGLCSAASIEAASTALEEAQKAASSLDQAEDLAGYERALGNLERQLERIDSDTGLSKSQRESRKQLQQQAEKARARQKQEKGHQQTVQQVRKERETLGKLAPPAAEERRTALLRRLEPIPAESFSHGEAEELRLELAPPAPPAPATPPTPEPESGGASQEPEAPTPSPEPAPAWQAPAPSPAPAWQAPAPAPRWSPPPQRSSPPPQSSGDGGGSNAPYRDEPLW
ncbi:MAG: hypothetical protein ACKO25_04970 [Cyanobium sp.]